MDNKKLKNFLDDEVDDTDIENALKKGADSDVVGSTGMILTVSIGAVCGVLLANIFGGMLGFNTIWGSQKLHSILGDVLISNTPFLFTIFCSFIGAIVGVGIAFLIRNGMKTNMNAKNRLQNFLNRKKD